MGKWVLAISTLLFCLPVKAQKSNSVLSSGSWIKISMTETGVYEVSYDDLAGATSGIASIESDRIQLFGNGSKMLPQANSAPRISDLQEVPFLLQDGGDGLFDAGDRIIFYAEDPNTLTGNTYDNNVYTDSTHYFLNIEGNGRMVMDADPAPSGTFPVQSTTDQYVAHEQDMLNFITSGREWYGERISTAGESFKIETPGIIQGEAMTVEVSAMGRSFEPTEFTVDINGAPAGEIPIRSVSTFIYGTQGREEREIFEVNAGSGSNVDVTIKYGNSAGVAYLNYIVVRYKRPISMTENSLIFYSDPTILEPRTIEIGNALESTMVWNITDPINTREVLLTMNGSKASFNIENPQKQKFCAFDLNTSQKKAAKLSSISNQNLHALKTPELLIITHPDFRDQAERLADLRRDFDGLSAEVVTTWQIFNEFSSGSQDVSAIRDAIRYYYLNPDPDSLRYVLLFGRASFDYKDTKPLNSNYVPTYQSYNNLGNVSSYSSDDYYGFMEESEGTWIENLEGDHTMDIAVGRLPVREWKEAKNVVDKLVHYSISRKSLGSWRNNIAFVADDEDVNTHQNQADRITEFVDSTAAQLKVSKIYVDAFEQLSTAGGESAPTVNERIDEAVQDGSVIINFTGHGSERRWTEEGILDLFMIDQWSNFDHMPLFVTATCEFGRFDNPDLISGGERALLNPEGGAIGLVTTTRPVLSSSNFILNKAFYRAAFERVNGRYKRLGDIFKDTKNSSLNGSNNRNFSLLGDPSMKLALPDLSAEITSINGLSPDQADTINALSTVSMAGRILLPDGTLATDFDGTVEVEVFDAASTRLTLGNKTPVMEYEEWENVIFRGKASARSGEFEVDFFVPKNISYRYENGRVNLYAYEDSGTIDAAGGTLNLSVGGSDLIVDDDQTPPEITLFMEDSTFVDGGLTGSNTRLAAYFFDESGINISGRGIGQRLIAVLDDKIEFDLAKYYSALEGDFRTGVAFLPLRNLSKGTHTLRVLAFDNFNNSNESTIRFRVEDNGQFIIEQLRNYPNPFMESTEFGFTHNRAGEDLDIIVQIYNTSGAIVNELKWILRESPSNVRGLVWNGTNSSGKKLTEGIYFYRVIIRSKLDGSKTQDYQKLILIN